jgi:hypothetical protein
MPVFSSAYLFRAFFLSMDIIAFQDFPGFFRIMRNQGSLPLISYGIRSKAYLVDEPCRKFAYKRILFASFVIYK